MPIVVYWRLRYALAPAWMAAAISRIRSLPAGIFMIQPIQTKPKTMAASAQRSAKMRPMDIFETLPKVAIESWGKSPRGLCPAPSTCRRRVHRGAIPPRRPEGSGRRFRQIRANPLLCQCAVQEVEPILPPVERVAVDVGGRAEDLAVDRLLR